MDHAPPGQLPAGRSRTALQSLRGWLLEYDAVVLTLLGVAIGAMLFYDGFTAL